MTPNKPQWKTRWFFSKTKHNIGDTVYIETQESRRKGTVIGYKKHRHYHEIRVCYAE